MPGTRVFHTGISNTLSGIASPDGCSVRVRVRAGGVQVATMAARPEGEASDHVGVQGEIIVFYSYNYAAKIVR